MSKYICSDKMEPIYNIDQLIYVLKKIRYEANENAEIYIKDTNLLDNYLRILDIRLDDANDVIIYLEN